MLRAMGYLLDYFILCIKSACHLPAKSEDERRPDCITRLPEAAYSSKHLGIVKNVLFLN